MVKRLIIIIFLFFITPQLEYTVYGQVTQVTQNKSAPLSYNSVITIEPTAFPGKLVWTHGASRYVAAGAKPPYNHAELLVGPQTNLDQQVGYQFFILQPVGNSTSIGPIDYGDDVEILSPAGSYGDLGLAGLYVPMKKWWVNDGHNTGPGITSARQNQATIYDIIVSDPNYPQTKDSSQIFKIMSTTNCEGHVYPNDPIYFVSQGPRDCKNRRLWCTTGSRIGSEFCEILVSPATSKQIIDQSIFKIKTVDNTALSPEAQALYNLAQGGVLPPTGDSSFTFIPAVYGGKNICYNAQWKIQAAGKGSVSFSARAKSDICVTLSSQSRTMPGAMYQIIIGENNNTKTTIRKDPKQLPIFEVTKIKNPKVMITGGLGDTSGTSKGDGTTWDDYWIKYESGTITLGKSSTIDKNVVLTWSEKNSNNQIQYVGFGGNQSLVEFRDITFSDVYSILNVPKGFDDAGNDAPASAIAVGSNQNGTIETWMIGKNDGAIYRYEQNSLAANAWTKLQMKDASGQVIPTFMSITLSSDGIAGAVSTIGTPYIFDPVSNSLHEIPARNASGLKLSKLAIGNNNSIWGIEQNSGDLYQLIKNKPVKMADGNVTINVNEWELRLKNCLDVAAGIDNTVIAITKNNQVSNYSNQKWTIMPNIKLTTIAVGSKNIIWGTYHHGTVFEIWQCNGNTWKKALGDDGQEALGFDAIDANAAGTVFANDDDGDLYNNGDSGVAIDTSSTGQPAADGITDVKIQTTSTVKSKRALAKQEGKLPTEKKRIKKRVRKKIKRTGNTIMQTPTKLP